jgi:hypothetical protein
VKRTLRKVHKLSPEEIKSASTEVTTLVTYIYHWAEVAALNGRPITREERNRICEKLKECQKHCDRTQTIVMKLPLARDGAEAAVDVVHVGSEQLLQPQLNG